MSAVENVLVQTVKSLDISPSDFERARSRYKAVKEWLLSGVYNSGLDPKVYLQGSFRLGTVVRPYYADKDGDFDIDQVCEITRPNSTIAPKTLKVDVGERIKSHGTYSSMLDDEGKRCWTLIYASEENRPGFHIDILPSATSTLAEDTQIHITDKDFDTSNYSWSTSDPNGYYQWFKSKNTFSSELLYRQSNQIFELNPELYSSPNEVPKRLIRSPLQRSIQLMKRHRDVHFSGKQYKPISIILTTITAHLYNVEKIDETVSSFTNYVSCRQHDLLKNGTLPYDGILDFMDGNWLVTNPVHSNKALQHRENFADKWNIDPQYALEFFEWARSLERALTRFKKSGLSDELNLKLPNASEGRSFSALLQDDLRTAIANDYQDMDGLLLLIHLGIEGLVSWDTVKSIAQKHCEVPTHVRNVDIAKINFYQIFRHRKIPFSEQDVRDIRAIMGRYPNCASFRLCSNLLLGTATKEMMRDCINANYSQNILTWPILKLANPSHLLI